MIETERVGPGGAEPESDFPRGMGHPARRALMAEGYVRMAQLAEVSDKELLKLHGVGPKALKVLRQALAERDAADLGPGAERTKFLRD